MRVLQAVVMTGVCRKRNVALYRLNMAQYLDFEFSDPNLRATD